MSLQQSIFICNDQRKHEIINHQQYRVNLTDICYKLNFQDSILTPRPWLHWVTLITGFIVGMLSAISWKLYNSSYVGDNFSRSRTWSESRYNFDLSDKLSNWFIDSNINKSSSSIPVAEIHARLSSLSLTCLINVKKFNFLATVNQTWASRCNQSFFYLASKDLPINSSLPTDKNIALIKGLSSSSSRRSSSLILSSWQQLCLTLSTTNFNTTRYTSADWFIIAPNSVFFIVENLKRYLISFNSTNLIYLGRPVNNHAQVNYNSFDSGIVLSRSAFLALMEAIRSTSNCSRTYLPAIGQIDRRLDVTISQILNHHKCKPIDTRDQFGRARFLALPLYQHIIPDNIPFDHPFWQQNIYPFPNGPDCCSDGLISIAGMTVNIMRFYDYLIYTMKVIGHVS